jgi:copper chaperone CopZ
METRTFKVPNIGCDRCIAKISDEIRRIEGVVEVSGNLNTRIVTVRWQHPAAWELIENRLTEIDYPPEPA